METKHNLKPFSCKFHSSEPIQRVCIDSSIDQSLYCIDCVINSTTNLPKSSILTLNDFIDHAAKRYEVFRSIAFEETAPRKLVKILSQRSENLEKFERHIEMQKEKVNEVFNELLQEFTLICHSNKEKILECLDTQLMTLRQNYSYYQSKIDRYYGQNQGKELNPGRDELVEKLNQCESTDEMEIVVKNIRDDLVKSSVFTAPELQIKEIQDGLTSLSQDLGKQCNVLPMLTFTSDQAGQKLRDVVNPLMEKLGTIKNEICEFNLSHTNFAGSKIIKKSEDTAMLTKWVSPNGNTTFKLLYSGSRDGMNTNTFLQKCDGIEKTLTVLKANGRVFGGYSNVSWNVTNNYNKSNKTWLFSLNEKKKFPIKSSMSVYATYSNSHNGPTFGGGHDLAIFIGSGQQCYSNLGHSYECGKGNGVYDQSTLAGSYYFTLDEIEIYAVHSISLSDEIDSGLIVAKGNLKILKEWTAKNWWKPLMALRSISQIVKSKTCEKKKKLL